MNLLLAIEFLRRFFQWEYICGWINIYTLVNSILCITIPSLRKQPFLLALCRSLWTFRTAGQAAKPGETAVFAGYTIPRNKKAKEDQKKDKIKKQNIGGMKWSHPYLIVPVSKRSLIKSVQFTENFLGPSDLTPQKLLALSYFFLFPTRQFEMYCNTLHKERWGSGGPSLVPLL